MAKQKPHIVHPLKVKVAELRGENETLKAAFGLEGSRNLVRLAVAYGHLVTASDPMPTRRPFDAGTPQHSEQWDKPLPGEATYSPRKAQQRIDREIGRVADRAEGALDDRGFRPPKGGQCGTCGRRGRPGDKFCGSCSGILAVVDDA